MVRTALILISGSLLATVAATAWGVWEAQTTVLQLATLVAVGTGWLADRLSDLPHHGVFATVAWFLAGANLGALSYHGETAILFAAMWFGLLIWIKREIRKDVRQRFDWLFDVLD